MQDFAFISGQQIGVKHSKRQLNTWHRLDMSAIQALWTVYSSDFIARSAKNYIASSLLSSGIVISDTSLKATPGADFQGFITENYVPFFGDLIDQIYVQGFCPYTVSDEGKPRAIPFGLLQVKFLIDDDYQLQLGAFDESTQDEPLKNVYFVIESLPNVDGSIVSAAAIYYSHRLFRDTLLRNTAVANYLMARPPIYLVQNTDKSYDDRDIANVGEVDGLRASLANDGQVVRNKIQMNVHQQQESLVNALNARRATALSDTALKSRTDPFTGLESYDNRMTNEADLQPTIPLPLDTMPATTVLPRAPENLVATLNQQLVIACGCFGITLEAIGLERGGGARSAETIQLENRSSQNTVRRFRNHMVQTLRNIYDLVWADDTNGLSGSTLLVLFPATLDRPTMLDLFNRGIVSFEGLRTYLGTSMDITPDSFNKSFKPPMEQFKQTQQEDIIKLQGDIQGRQAQEMAQLQAKQAQELARLNAKLTPKPT